MNGTTVHTVGLGGLVRWGLWAVPLGMACSSMEAGEGWGGRHMEGNAYHVNLFKYCDMDTQLNHTLWVAC